MIKPTSRKPEVFAYSAVDATGSKPAKNLFKNALVTYHATGLLPSELAAQRDELLAALENIKLRCAEHPDDDNADCKRNLYHAHSMTKHAITNAKGKTE